jgi:hypothetical protein
MSAPRREPAGAPGGPEGASRPPRRPVRIANCSGFYGDRLDAPREILEGPEPVDFLTGDYLAELTMLILWKARQADPSAGYAASFLRQMEGVLGTCLDAGVKVVANAGGLNPAGLARRLRELAERLGLDPRIAVVEGDDIAGRLEEIQADGWPFAHLDTGQTLAEAGVQPLTANAYLGCWGIVSALSAGADVVVCPRVTDASLAVGPAAWWHGWGAADHDNLAGAVVAGHVIECGAQATGGNYCFLDELPDTRYPGFPIAEVAGDGSCVVTKQPGTGGVVTVGTVTAQLLYEVEGPAYLSPDAVARFDTVAVEQVGPDRVRLSGTRGEPPPGELKVAINYAGGFRNSMTMVLTGLDIAAKAARAESMLWELLGPKEQFESVDVTLVRSDHPDSPRNEEATAQLRVTVMDPDPQKVGRQFSGAVVEMVLGGYAGFFTTTPPTNESSYGVFWPALVPRSYVTERVVLDGGEVEVEAPGHAVTRTQEAARPKPCAPSAEGGQGATVTRGRRTRAPLGALCGARSGDKGGNANVGLWTRDDASYRWLRSELTIERFCELLPEAQGLRVERFELPNLRALNFVVRGLLGRGVAASARADPQAKGLGEYLRSRFIEIPDELLRPR